MLRDFSKEAFDIIIQAGQSNSGGSGFGYVDSPYEPSELVWFLEQDGTIVCARERAAGNGVRSNFVFTFVSEYIKSGRLKDGRKLLVIKAAVGGTGFLDNRWKQNDDLFLQMMEMTRTALSLNPENRLVAFLWHQGETDALRHHATYEQHFYHLSTLLELVRNTFDAPKLPFVAGDFVQQWKLDNIEICTPVVDAIRAVCREYSYCAFVESEGLLSNAQVGLDPVLDKQSDTIHFSRPALYELGIRYFEQFSKISNQ